MSYTAKLLLICQIVDGLLHAIHIDYNVRIGGQSIQMVKHNENLYTSMIHKDLDFNFYRWNEPFVEPEQKQLFISVA